MKKFIHAALALLLSLMLCTGAFADAGMSLRIQDLAIQNDVSLQMQFYSSVTGNLQPQDLTLNLDAAQLNVESVSEYNQGASWLILVETASVTVYTVSYTEDTGSETVSNFGSLARSSLGGLEIHVLPSDDLKISGTHMILRYIQGSMFVEDLSRNGTKVNDVRISKPTKLHQQDILTLDLSRYRIMWDIR